MCFFPSLAIQNVALFGPHSYIKDKSVVVKGVVEVGSIFLIQQ